MKLNWNNATLNGIRPVGTSHDEQQYVGTFVTQDGQRCELPLEKDHARELGRIGFGERVSLTIEIDSRAR